jgi:23S rRNA (adenine2503-C2)-methyltransferase
MVDHAPTPRTTATPVRGLFDLTPESLKELLGACGEPAYRAKQILEWAYQHAVTSYDEMTNLSKSLRARMAEELAFYQSTILKRQNSSDGTVKLLLRWPDRTTSECVLIPDAERRTACISTQVGCPVGCVFCASGLDGLERSLPAGQIVEQAMRVRQVCGDSPRLSNVVFMGLGEPLANYDATVRAIRTINADWGVGIGARKITVSTIGLPGPMRRLADEGMQITLAISLHAATDRLRRALIPWAGRVTIQALIEAADYYFDRTGREVTLEYLLLAGINDSEKDAHELAGVARRLRGNVNLLAYNAVEGLPYHRPTDEAVARFLSWLRARGINAHLRQSRGLDIDGACGQLRRHTVE